MGFHYWVLRYVPSPVREEFVNVGIIAGDGNDWAIRRVSNLQRATRLGGSATVTAAFVERITRAIDHDLNAVEALLEAPRERISRGLMEDLATRMNGTIQLSRPRAIRASSAEEAADLAFDLMVVDDGATVRHRSRTLVARHAQDAFAGDPYLSRHLARARQARVEDQRIDYDVAVTGDTAVQLTQAWSFDLKNLGRLETNIQAWNYLVDRIRRRGGELVRPRHPEAAPITILPSVDVNVVYRAPRTNEGRRQLTIAMRGWDELQVQAVPEEQVDTLVTEARQLLTA